MFMKSMNDRNRAYRLGEFSSIGRVLTLCRFFFKFRSCPNFWATIFHGLSNVITLANNDWATVWAFFLTNSSGHPGPYSCWKTLAASPTKYALFNKVHFQYAEPRLAR
jgi:hypothetical protein